jgi:tape measure domain-containing protein
MKIAKVSRGVASTYKKANTEMSLSSKSTARSIGKTNDALSNLKRTAKNYLGIFAMFQGAKGLVKLGFDAEQSRIKFEVLLGSASKATKLLDTLDQFANKTPFENSDLKKSAELLLNFGIANKKILPTLRMIGDVSGGNKERFNGLTLAYAQVSSTGKLMGQDLMQMINAGFNPLKVISEKTGVSLVKLKEKMSKGGISAKMVEDAFRIATSEGGRFHGMMEKISKTGWGLLSTTFGKLNSKLAKFSESNIVPFVTKLLNLSIEFIDKFGKISNAVNDLITPLKPLLSMLFDTLGVFFGISGAGLGVQGVIDGIASVISVIATPIEIFITGLVQVVEWLSKLKFILKPLAYLIGGVTIAFKLFNFVMSMNPIVRIITLVSLLVGAFMVAYKKIGWFRGAVDAMWTSLKGFASMLKTYVINRIHDMIKGISGIGTTLMLFFKGKWKEAWEVGKKAARDLMGVDTKKQLLNDALQVGKNSALAYAKGISSVKKNKASLLAKKLEKEKNQKESDTDDTSLANLDTLKSGIDGITGGGNRQTNIQVSFEKMIENMVIKSETITEGIDELEDKVKDVLLRILNSANQMQTT